MSKRCRHPVDVLRAADTRAFSVGHREEQYLKTAFRSWERDLAVIVRTRHHALLYDSGENLNADFNIVPAVVVHALRWLGIRALDVVAISYCDNDHVGGLLVLSRISK